MLSLQQWVLLVFSFLAGLLAVASTLGLSVSMVKAIMNKGWGLLTHCKFFDEDVGSSSVTYECPFDPTRIYVSSVEYEYFIISRLDIDLNEVFIDQSYVPSSVLSSRGPQSFCGCLSS